MKDFLGLDIYARKIWNDNMDIKQEKSSTIALKVFLLYWSANGLKV
mgnify:CR=1 FL=1